MTAIQSFRSEAYKDGRRYTFTARFDETLWTAVIRDESGRRRGAISCESHQPGLRGDALEDAVCDWVHRAVDNNVGFSDQLTLSGCSAVRAPMFPSALQIELQRARSMRAELALTFTKFNEAYAAYVEQRIETAHRNDPKRVITRATGETVSARDVACAEHHH